MFFWLNKVCDFPSEVTLIDTNNSSTAYVVIKSPQYTSDEFIVLFQFVSCNNF